MIACSSLVVSATSGRSAIASTGTCTSCDATVGVSQIECAVVGAPDEQRGQVVKAFVVLREGYSAGDEMMKTLQDHAKQSIAPYKYPRRVEFVDSLPRTQTGKLQRFRLRQQETGG